MLRDKMLKILLQQYWHEAADPGCPLFRRYRGESRPSADMPKSTQMTRLKHGRLKTFAAQKHCSFLR
jgi:hypothetical protein